MTLQLLRLRGLQRSIRQIPRSGYATQPLREKERETPRSRPLKSTFLTPREICEWLDGFVVGQQLAKKVLATAVYYHYVRIRANRQEFEVYPRSQPEYEKSSIMMMPTGTGKTFLFRQLLKILKVPYSISDATTFTQSGYVGEDVQMCIQRLFENSNNDPVATSEGIVFIDEIDKIRKTTGGVDGSRDVGGEGVQQALLKLVEGHQVTVKSNLSSSPATFTGAKPDAYSIDTRNILFIVSGAFVGLDDIVKKRLDKESGKGIGFSVLTPKNPPPTADFFTPNNSLGAVEAKDLQTFGFIPEFVARFPLRVSLSPLTISDLHRVLVDVQGSLVSQAMAEFRFISVELCFTPAALQEICVKAASIGGGARSLMDVMQGVLLEPKYQIPGSNIGYVLITLATVRHGKEAMCWDKGQGKHFYSARASIEELEKE